MVFRDVTAGRRAEAALRDSEARQAFLLRLSDAIRPLSDPDRIMAIVSEMTGRHFRAGRCGYAEPPPSPSASPSPDRLVVARDWTGAAMASLQGACPLAMLDQAFLSRHRAEQPVVVADLPDDARAPGGGAADGLRSGIWIRLVRDGREVACLYVHDNAARDWRRPTST